MILGSCYSFQGKSHKVSNTVCQDASVVKTIIGDWTVMAIADGVGSCPKSDVGSKTAVETASELCVQAFPMDGSDEAILALLRTAFNYAMRAVAKVAKEAEEDIALYDTTLDLVIFNGASKLYYGHCGDGGIFILNSDGDYKEITTVQEGEEASSVMPLRSGNGFWDFGIYEDEVAVVAAFTDGIRDKISTPLLRNEVCTIDVPLANKFMFVDVYGMSESETTETLKQSMQTSAVYLHAADCNITDDVTMGILVNTSILIREDPAERYEKPDWAKIWYDVIERLYPDPDAVNQVFRRHKLEDYIIKNPDKCNAVGEQLEQLLDRYYPLTSEEAEQYEAKYRKPKESDEEKKSTGIEEKVSEKPDEVPEETGIHQKETESIQGKIRSSFEELIDGIRTTLKYKTQLKETESGMQETIATQKDKSSLDRIPLTPEETISRIRQEKTAEELDVPISETPVVPNRDEAELPNSEEQEDSE